MLGTGPIRIGRDEWVLMRNDPRVPAAIVRRLHPGTRLEHYRVVTFDVDSARRLLVGRYTSLEAADRSVLYERPADHTPPHSGYPRYDYPPLTTVRRWPSAAP